MSEYQLEGDKEVARYKLLRGEIERYEKDARPWIDRGKKIINIYKDGNNKKGEKKRFNVLWSNVETLKPALYARDPQPEVERRFKDRDPVGRVGSEVLERCIAYVLDRANVGHKMRQAVNDRLLPGRGTLWVRYKGEFRPLSESEGEELTNEHVHVDYVYWQDFGHSAARHWEEVRYVWRRVYYKRNELVERFGDVGKEIPLDASPPDLDERKVKDEHKTACIYEMWDRRKSRVIFLSKNHPKIIGEEKDPLQLDGGFPCPRPLFSTQTTDSLIPIPDYKLYQTQAQEIENLTARINSLQKALKVVGVYDSSVPELSRILNDSYENKMIPIAEWMKFSEKGGISGGIDFMPLKEIAETLIGLYEAREQAKADLYEITGIADIIRGNSDPNDTATAQQIKGRFAVLRISDTQADVQRFARDTVRLIGEIVAEHFDIETIKAISGMKLLTMQQKQQAQEVMQAMQSQEQAGMMVAQSLMQGLPENWQEMAEQPTWEEVHGLISDQVLRGFRLDIETDSTIRTDEEIDRKERTEFLTAAGGFLSSAIEGAQAEPALAPLLAEMLMFGIRGHKAARQLEPAFEDALREIQKPKPPAPDPEKQKIEAQLQAKREEAQLDAQVARNEQQAQAEQEREKLILEDQRAERDAEREMAMKDMEFRLEERMRRLEAMLEAETAREVATIQANARREGEVRQPVE